MISMGKYAAAAKGPKSVRSQGGVSLRSLRQPHSNVSAQITTRGNPVPKRGTPTGSSAGLKTQKRAYIQPNGGGYDNAPLRTPPAMGAPAPAVYMPKIPVHGSSSNYSTKRGYSGLLADRELASLL